MKKYFLNIIIVLIIVLSSFPLVSGSFLSSSHKEIKNYIKSTKGNLVDNVIIEWYGTIFFRDVFLAFLGLPVYFTQAKIRNNNNVSLDCEAYITLSTGDGKILDECIYNPPFTHNPHSTDTLLLFTLHNWQDYDYLWGHFDIAIDFHIQNDDSSIKKSFHGFVYHYGSFIYNKDGKFI
jgi:hypothetical protein